MLLSHNTNASSVRAKVLNHLRRYGLFYALLLLGLAIRCVFIHEQGFGNDELSALCRTRVETWETFWNKGVKVGDMHPVFYQALLWGWVRIFGDSEWAVRATSLLFYVANSFLIFAIARKHFTQLSGLLFLALYVGLTFTIINTVFARPYNSGTFFVLLAYWAVLEFHKSTILAPRKWMLVFAGGCLGAMLSHYVAFLAVALLGVCSLLFVARPNRKFLVLGGMLAVLLFLPHLPVTLYQLQRGGLGWLPAPKALWLVDFIHQLFNNDWRLAGGLTAVFLIALRMNGVNPWTPVQAFSVCLFLVVFVVAFVLSYLFTPIMRDLAMLFILPWLLLPLFALIKASSVRKNAVLVLGMAVFPLLHSCLVDRLFQPVHYAVFREMGEEINEVMTHYGKENITFASSYNGIDYLNYYLDDDLEEPILDWEMKDAFYALHERVVNAQTPYFCYSMSNKFHSPMFLEVIRRSFPVERKVFATPYSIVYCSEKGQVKNRLVALAFEEKHSDTVSTDEFSGNLALKVGALPAMEGFSYFLIEAEGMLLDTSELHLVLTVERDGKMLTNADESPVCYIAEDQAKLCPMGKPTTFYLAFQLPVTLHATDQLHAYFWNPKRSRVKVGRLVLYCRNIGARK